MTDTTKLELAPGTEELFQEDNSGRLCLVLCDDSGFHRAMHLTKGGCSLIDKVAAAIQMAAWSEGGKRAPLDPSWSRHCETQVELWRAWAGWPEHAARHYTPTMGQKEEDTK